MRCCLSALLALSLLLLGSDCEEDRLDDLDEGRMVRDGVELRRCAYPVTVAADATLEDLSVLLEAAAAWDAWAGFDTFEVVEGFAPDVTVAVGFAGDGDEGDLTTVGFAEHGCITDVEVVLSSDIAYDRAVLLKTLEHSLGHSLGLENDPGPPECVDLRSIMSSPLDPLGVLTEHDRELL